MISFSTLLLYTAGAFLILISPGPDFIYVTTRGISQGRKAGLLSAAGISLGLTVHTILAALGLSAILTTSDIAFQTIKYSGALYLIILAFKSLVYGDQVTLFSDNRSMDELSILRQGIFTNVLNPKAILTFMAFIPQFINPTDKHATMQILILGGLLAFLAILWFGIVGFFAGALGQWLVKRSSFQQLIRWLSGSVFLALGLRLAFMKNNIGGRK